MNNIKFKKFFVKPQIPENLSKLNELAYNVWSTWDKDATQLFYRLDPVQFRKYSHNPVEMLHHVKMKRLDELAQDKGFLYEMKTVYKKYTAYMNFEGHVVKDESHTEAYPQDFLVAYLSMEFGMHESVPVYSGGLGILAGDHLKSASDLALPLKGFGLLYRYGYFKQRINFQGMQEEIYLENDWNTKAVVRVKNADGTDLILSIPIRGEEVYFKTSKVKVGKVDLFLLDTNISQNSDFYRKITDYLYVSDKTMRMLQEILLSYGSVKLMKALDIEPTIYHMNEGHSAFLIIKRLRDLMLEQKLSFDEASAIVRASSVFTTHTPVPAGNEQFSMDLIRHYLGDKIKEMNWDVEEFCKFARVKGDNNFWLPALAIRFSNYINGVSKLHADVSKEMWQDIFPDYYLDEIPIQAITNGVHIHSWLSVQLSSLFDRYIGPDYLHMAEKKSVWQNIYSIPDEEIWKAHQTRKEQMIHFIRERIRLNLVHQRGNASANHGVTNILDPHALTIGFARRFAAYKRSHLILNNKERILTIIRNPIRPVQFVFAGKAHPADEKGKAIIKEILDFARDNDVEDRFVFVENYDINVARHLVQGVDVWLNNPIKPKEASGTSGMKAGMNGVLNLSVPDGWWPECSNDRNGWDINAGEGISEPELRDKLEANQIYDLLEGEISELFYHKPGESDISPAWVKMMKHSIYDVGQGFNTHRMLRDYINFFYMPSCLFSEKLQKNNYEKLRSILHKKQLIEKYWPHVQALSFEIDDINEIKNGDELQIEAKIQLGDAPADLFSVEAFYVYDNKKHRRKTLQLISQDADNVAVYTGSIKVHDSGEQMISLRIRAQICSRSHHLCDYVKWFS